MTGKFVYTSATIINKSAKIWWCESSKTIDTVAGQRNHYSKKSITVHNINLKNSHMNPSLSQSRKKYSVKSVFFVDKYKNTIIEPKN